MGLVRYRIQRLSSVRLGTLVIEQGQVSHLTWTNRTNSVTNFVPNDALLRRVSAQEVCIHNINSALYPIELQNQFQ